MNLMRYTPLVAALSLVAVGSPLRSDEQQPHTTPTRDADITYQITPPGEPVIVERRRWLAGQQLRRVDGPDNYTTIFDQNTGEFTLLNAANRTYRKLEGLPTSRWLRKKGRSCAAANLRSLGSIVLTGLGSTTQKRIPPASLRTVCCFVSSSTVRS